MELNYVKKNYNCIIFYNYLTTVLITKCFLEFTFYFCLHDYSDYRKKKKKRFLSLSQIATSQQFLPDTIF